MKWILSFMRSGRALQWAERLWEKEATAGFFPFLRFSEFEAEFRSRFLVEDEEDQALLRLETTLYYQGKRAVVDYIDEFENLVARAGLKDERAIIMKFRHGLDPTLQSAIATSGNPPSTINGWTTAAKRHHDARLSNALFEGTSRNAAPLKTSSGSLLCPPPPTHPRTFAPPVRPLSAGVPMDVDRSRQRARLPPTCFRCGKPGHISCECPEVRDIRTTESFFDEVVRQLTVEEIEEVLARAKDAEEVRRLSESERSPLQKEVEEDFLSGRE